MPKQSSQDSTRVVLQVQPRAMRPQAAAAYAGVTPFQIEEAWRSGALAYKVIGGARISTVEQLNKWIDSFADEAGAREAVGMYASKSSK